MREKEWKATKRAFVSHHIRIESSSPDLLMDRTKAHSHMLIIILMMIPFECESKHLVCFSRDRTVDRNANERNQSWNESWCMAYLDTVWMKSNAGYTSTQHWDVVRTWLCRLWHTQQTCLNCMAQEGSGEYYSFLLSGRKLFLSESLVGEWECIDTLYLIVREWLNICVTLTRLVIHYAPFSPFTDPPEFINLLNQLSLQKDNVVCLCVCWRMFVIRTRSTHSHILQHCLLCSMSASIHHYLHTSISHSHSLLCKTNSRNAKTMNWLH